jgi:hypothetical protein
MAVFASCWVVAFNTDGVEYTRLSATRAILQFGERVRITEICVMLENDPALRGRNAQTLSGLEGSSNMGCL